MTDDGHAAVIRMSGAPVVYACEACAGWPDLVRRAEERAPRELTEAERHRYLGG